MSRSSRSRRPETVSSFVAPLCQGRVQRLLCQIGDPTESSTLEKKKTRRTCACPVRDKHFQPETKAQLTPNGFYMYTECSSALYSRCRAPESVRVSRVQKQETRSKRAVAEVKLLRTSSGRPGAHVAHGANYADLQAAESAPTTVQYSNGYSHFSGLDSTSASLGGISLDASEQLIRLRSARRVHPL